MEELNGPKHIPSNPDYKRRIPLSPDFMNWKKSDLLYGYLVYCATYNAEDGILYLDKNSYQNGVMQAAMKVCHYNSRQVLRRNINKYIASGYIYEGEVNYGSTKIPAFIFTQDERERYQLVQHEMVWYLVMTSNHNCLTIYTYLLNKFLWKHHYEFTYREIREVLGYSDDYNGYYANKMIETILQDFYRRGILDYECSWKMVLDRTGRTVPTPIFILTNVAEKVSELPEAPRHDEAPTRRRKK